MVTSRLLLTIYRKYPYHVPEGAGPRVGGGSRERLVAFRIDLTLSVKWGGKGLIAFPARGENFAVSVTHSYTAGQITNWFC